MSAPSTSAGKRSQIAAQVSFLASAAFVLLLVALHFLRPDLDPS